MPIDLSNFAKIDVPGSEVGSASATSTVNGSFVPSLYVTNYRNGDDWTADIGAAINRAISAAAALSTPANVILPNINAALTTTIVPQNYVSLIGGGWGKTVIRPQGTAAAVQLLGTAGTPLTGCDFYEFEIDGSQQSGTYSVGIKGMYIQYMLRCRMEHLYVHDTYASGIGTDFLGAGCAIIDNSTSGCGRGQDGSQLGGAGIGIGLAGTTDDEPIRIAHNQSSGNKRFGIFIEAQAGTNAQDSRGVSITNNWCNGNQHGIGLTGGRWTNCAHNQCFNNTVSGITCSPGTTGPSRADQEGIIADNICEGNVQGIILDYTSTNAPPGHMTVHNNTVGNNTGNGVQVKLDTLTVYGLNVVDNVVENNALSGVRVYYAGSTNNAVLRNSNFANNMLRQNGTSATLNDKSGMRVEVPMTRCRVADNQGANDGGFGAATQDIGIVLTGNLVGCHIQDNDVGGNVSTAGMSITGTIDSLTRISGNGAYAPPAASSVTVTASPMTVTPSTEAATWIIITGGTVSSVTVAGQTYATATNVVLPVEPNDAVIVTYSVAPTILSRKR